jgi:hypothetical protein
VGGLLITLESPSCPRSADSACHQPAHSAVVARISPFVVRLLVRRLAHTLLAGGIFVALGVLHLDKTVTSLLTGVGILGLTLGFALQDVASNMMAGLLIELHHPFRVDDVIETNNFVGRVSRITLRDTEIAQLDGQIVVVPNKEIFNKPVVTTAASRRRVDFRSKCRRTPTSTRRCNSRTTLSPASTAGTNERRSNCSSGRSKTPAPPFWCASGSTARTNASTSAPEAWAFNE